MGTAGASAAAAIAQATKASGVVVSVEPADFLAILAAAGDPLVVQAPGGWFQRANQYLTSYKGLAFFTQSETELPLPPAAQLVQAKKIWIPG